jgi:hypothetical protein
MSKPRIIVGASGLDEVNPGESMRYRLTYKDDTDQPIELTGATVTVFKSNDPMLLENATVSVTNATLGIVDFEISGEFTVCWTPGLHRWFRVKMIYPSGSNDVTPQIWIQVT